MSRGPGPIRRTLWKPRDAADNSACVEAWKHLNERCDKLVILLNRAGVWGGSTTPSVTFRASIKPVIQCSRRNAGNIVPSYGPEPGRVSASVEYAVAVLRVTGIVLCGHSDCGAMKAISSGQHLDHLPAAAGWLRYADSAKVMNASRLHASPEASLNTLIHENVIAQLTNIRTHPAVAVALAEKRLTLHGWVYDIEKGFIDALDSGTGLFAPLTTLPSTSHQPLQCSAENA